METNELVNEDQFGHEYVDEVYDDTDEVDALVEVKVSGDGGETWTRRTINLGGDIEESGLNMGEIFKLSGEKYKVLEGEVGLRIEPIQKPVSGKKPVRRK